MNPNDFIPSPDMIKGLGWFAAMLIMRDFSLVSLDRLARKCRATPDKGDDWLADLADVVAATVRRLPLPSLVKKPK